MNRRRWLAVAAATLLLLPGTTQKANPIIEGFLNEILFTSAGWRIEMHVLTGMTLDGWSLRSQHGQATFRNGIQLGGVYRIITPESLLTPLAIDPAGDTLELFSPQYPVAYLSFGPGANFPAPVQGQSLCLRENGWEYYLDNSPTPGAPNDAMNAMGTVSGHVRDTLGAPISGVMVNWGMSSPPLYSDSAGYYSFSDYACPVNVTFSHAGFEPQSIYRQIWPESTVVMDVVLDLAVAADEDVVPLPEFGLRAAYPNPFNPEVHFEMVLPSRSHVRLVLYDVAGREVAVVADGEMEAGVHDVLFDGTGLASGVYMARLESEGRAATRKVVLVR